MSTEFYISESNSSARFLTGTAVDGWCREMGIENFTVNPDGTVDATDDVYIINRRLTSIPVRFGRVDGFFVCTDNRLVSLEGSPRSAGAGFECQGNLLRTLDGCPDAVDSGVFKCGRNRLATLNGLPDLGSRASVVASHNLLMRVGDLPGSMKVLKVSYNALTTLEGCPDVVELLFNFSFNPLDTIYGLPKVCDTYVADNVPIIKRPYAFDRAMRMIPEELRATLSRDAVYVLAARIDPALGPLFFPDGMPDDIDIDDADSISNFL